MVVIVEFVIIMNRAVILSNIVLNGLQLCLLCLYRTTLFPYAFGSGAEDFFTCSLSLHPFRDQKPLFKM
jgi:hypothetical protein